MKQEIRTGHQLQSCKDGGSWFSCSAGFYEPAVRLAKKGRLVEAIEEAERLRVEHYGDATGFTFRVVTMTEAITTI